MLDTPCSEVQRKSTGYPLHSPVSPSLSFSCVTVCHHVSTGHYLALESHINIILLHRQYHTAAQTISYCCTDNIILLHRQYHTAAQTISYCCTDNSSLCAFLTRQQLLHLAPCNEALCHCKSGSCRRAKLPAFHRNLLFLQGTPCRNWLTHCSTIRKVAVSFPDGVIQNFH